MNVTLDLEKRIWLIDNIVALPCTEALIIAADPLVSKLAPSNEESSVEGLELSVDEKGFSWNREVEKTSIPEITVDIPEIVISSLSKKFNEHFEDRDSLSLKMIEMLCL